MKTYNIEQKLIDSRLASHEGNKQFVNKTMQAIAELHVHESARVEHKELHTSRMRSIVAWFQSLSFAASVAVVALFVLFTGGIVYASVEYIPRLIEILSKTETDRGTTEYIVPDYVGCNQYDQLGADRFELKRDAPETSDKEVEKILQAKCELEGINAFVDSVWQTYGANDDWQDGDMIYYSRPDQLGTVVEVSEDSLTIDFTSNGYKPGVKDQPALTKTYSSISPNSLQVFSVGSEKSFADIRSGDVVFTVVEVSETYIDYSKNPEAFGGELNNPTELGLVGIIKMALPIDYYHEKQSYLTEIGSCVNNKDLCPRSTASIDVYPRNTGEGYSAGGRAPNQGAGSIFRTITGEVTDLGDSNLILESRNGDIYKVQTPDNAIKDYNEIYTLPYLEQGTDAMLRPGSTVEVLYYQDESDDPRDINKIDLFSIMLLFDGLNPKGSDLKQY